MHHFVVTWISWWFQKSKLILNRSWKPDVLRHRPKNKINWTWCCLETVPLEVYISFDDRVVVMRLAFSERACLMSRAENYLLQGHFSFMMQDGALERKMSRWVRKGKEELLEGSKLPMTTHPLKSFLLLFVTGWGHIVCALISLLASEKFKKKICLLFLQN